MICVLGKISHTFVYDSGQLIIIARKSVLNLIIVFVVCFLCFLKVFLFVNYLLQNIETSHTHSQSSCTQSFKYVSHLQNGGF